MKRLKKEKYNKELSIQSQVNNFGKGAFPDRPDSRDFKYEDVVLGAPVIDWEKGYDVETALGITLKVESQNGSSSCFPANSLVLMEDLSYKEISKITVGDYIFSHKGNIKKVKEIMKRKWQGTMNILKIYGDYRGIESTYEHPFYAIKRLIYKKNNRHLKDSNGKKYWLKNEELVRNEIPNFYEVKDLNVGDWLAMPFNNVVKDLTIYNYERDPDFLWLLGLYIAEGCIQKYGVTLSLHRNEFDWFEKIKRIMSRYGANISYSFKKGGNENSLSIYIYGEKWAKIFLDLGGKICNKKEINKRLMFLEPSLQMNIYNGVIDGDGCELKNRNTLVSTSYLLLIQLRTILLRNGIYSSLQIRKKRDDRKQVWVLEVSHNKNRYSFIRDNYCFVQIKNINHNKSYAGGHVYNLEVEDDNSYQVNGIAVHNCVGQAYSKYAEVLNIVEEKRFVDLSAKSVYERIYLPNGGAYLREGAKAIVGGINEEVDVLSYENGNPPSEAYMRSQTLTNELRLKAEKYASKEYRSIGSANTDLIALAIKDNWGAVTGLSGDNKGWTDWVIKNPIHADWGHCIFLKGFGKDERGRYIDFINSWGSGWGKNGQGRIYVDEYDMANNAFGIWTLVDKPNLSNIEEPMKLVKTANDPDVYLIRGNKRIMIVDGPTLDSLVDPFIVITDEEMVQYVDGGTLVFVERIIN